MTESEFDAEVVAKLWARSFSSCERCGRGLARSGRGRQWSAHHRQPRGMGGSGNAALGQASNGLVLCGHGTAGCHGIVEANRRQAIELGQIVPGNIPPAEVPVQLYLFGWVRLLDNGDVTNP